MVGSSPAEELEQATLIQSMGLDCQVDEQILKRRGCRFDCSGGEMCGAHARLIA